MTGILGDTAKVVALRIGALSILGRNIFPSALYQEHWTTNLLPSSSSYKEILPPKTSAVGTTSHGWDRVGSAAGEGGGSKPSSG
ncbi:hypothetical protein AlacWU_06966 [Aspergillus niger]|nr:hypothetical protein AlacWU_06966 [Aspergillus niger]